MRILFISLLLLTLVGCANFAWHRPALYYNDSKALADLSLQQYVADQNRQQNSIPFKNGGLQFTYTPLNWGTASEEKGLRK